MGASLEFDDVLAHYGIKGMKWGVRRTPEQLRRARGKLPWEGKVQERRERKAAQARQKTADKARPASDDARRASEARRVARNAGVAKLSNQDLQHLVNRMNLENQYTKLLGDDQKSTGRKFIDNLLKAETQAIKQGKPSPTGQMTKGLKSALDKALKDK